MHDRTAPTICGKIAELGTQPFGFIHDADGKRYHFYFDQVTGIESNGQYARLVQGAVTSRKEAKYDVTLRVGDQVRFRAQKHAKGKRAAEITLVFDTLQTKRRKTSIAPPCAVKTLPSVATRDQKNMLNALCDTRAENGGIPKQCNLRKTVNALRHMEVGIGAAPTYEQAAALLQRVCQEEPRCAEMLRREFRYAAADP